jgi:hypothetical protein
MKSFSDHHGFDEYEYDEQERGPRQPKCNRCGSTDVRWRMQSGKWTLFSSKPGVEHVCPIKDDFEALD